MGKSRFLAICSCAAMLAAAGRSQAADWWFVPQERTVERLLYVDKASLDRPGRGSRVTAWVLTVFKADQPSAKGAYRSEKRRLVVDCENTLAGADAFFRYSAYGSLIEQSRFSAVELGPLEPSSLDELASQFLCSGGKQPFRTIPVYDPGKDSEQRFWLKDREHAAPGRSGEAGR